MKEIKLTNGGTTLVDDEDFLRFGALGWLAYRDHNTRYVQRYVRRADGSRTAEKLHRVVMGLVPGGGLQVDHLDGNGLNNARANLRVVTHAQNQRNQGMRATNTSGFPGVYWDTARGKWRSRIRVPGRGRSLGYYDDRVEAGFVYAMAARNRDPLCRVVFPESVMNGEESPQAWWARQQADEIGEAA